MSVADTIGSLTRTVADLYREIATTSVRYEALQHRTEELLSRFERLIEQHAQRVQAMHDDHVRERATLQAHIEILEGRLNTLSEKALHTAVHEAAREIARESLVHASNTQEIP